MIYLGLGEFGFLGARTTKVIGVLGVGFTCVEDKQCLVLHFHPIILSEKYYFERNICEKMFGFPLRELAKICTYVLV